MVKDATRGTAVIVAVHGGELWSDLAFVMLQREFDPVQEEVIVYR